MKIMIVIAIVSLGFVIASCKPRTNSSVKSVSADAGSSDSMASDASSLLSAIDSDLEAARSLSAQIDTMAESKDEVAIALPEAEVDTAFALSADSDAGAAASSLQALAERTNKVFDGVATKDFKQTIAKQVPELLAECASARAALQKSIADLQQIRDSMEKAKTSEDITTVRSTAVAAEAKIKEVLKQGALLRSVTEKLVSYTKANEGFFNTEPGKLYNVAEFNKAFTSQALQGDELCSWSTLREIDQKVVYSKSIDFRPDIVAIPPDAIGKAVDVSRVREKKFDAAYFVTRLRYAVDIEGTRRQGDLYCRWDSYYGGISEDDGLILIVKDLQPQITISISNWGELGPTYRVEPDRGGVVNVDGMKVVMKRYLYARHWWSHWSQCLYASASIERRGWNCSSYSASDIIKQRSSNR